MATRSFIVTGSLVNDETGKEEGFITLGSRGRSLKEVRFLQDTLKTGYGAVLEAIGDDLAEKEVA